MTAIYLASSTLPREVARERKYARWARRTLQVAIQAGRVQRHPESCTACGVRGHLGGGKCRRRWSIVYHHKVYRYPLVLTPLCDACHRLVHSGAIAEPKPTVMLFGDAGVGL